MIVLKKKFIIPKLTPIITQYDQCIIILKHLYYDVEHKITHCYISHINLFLMILALIFLTSVILHIKLFLLHTPLTNIQSDAKKYIIPLFYYSIILLFYYSIIINIFITYEMEFLYGHFKITNLTYKIFVFFMYLHTIYYFLMFKAYTEHYKNDFYLIFLIFLSIGTPILYVLNSTLSFFFYIELISLFFLFLLVVKLQYIPAMSIDLAFDNKNLHKLIFKKLFFTLNIYFWLMALISLIFYIWYYVYICNTLQVNWFAVNFSIFVDYKNLNWSVNLFFLIFIFLKGGWLPFFMWKLSFVKYMDTKILLVYLVFYYSIIFLFIHYVTNVFLYYLLIVNLKYFISLIVGTYLFIGYLSVNITSFNFFLIVSSVLNAFILFLLIFIFYVDVTADVTYIL